MASLLIVRGPLSGTRADLAKEYTIIGRGRHCDLILPRVAISRRHARITRRGGRLVLDDLDSPPGTYLNGRQILGLSPLRDGDRMRICDSEAVVESPVAMTPDDWRGSSDSQALLLCWREQGGSAERPLRLFVAACWRRFNLLTCVADTEAILEQVEEKAEEGCGPENLPPRQNWLCAADPWLAAAEAARQAVEQATSSRRGLLLQEGRPCLVRPAGRGGPLGRAGLLLAGHRRPLCPVPRTTEGCIMLTLIDKPTRIEAVCLPAFPPPDRASGRDLTGWCSPSPCPYRREGDKHG
jgi:hypothetical protein